MRSHLHSLVEAASETVVGKSLLQHQLKGGHDVHGLGGARGLLHDNLGGGDFLSEKGPQPTGVKV